MATALQYLPAYGDAVAKQPERNGILDLLKAGGQSAWGALRYDLPRGVETLAGTLTPEDKDYYDAWSAYQQQQAQQTAPQGAAGFEDVWSGKVGLTRALVENLAYSAPYAAGALVGGIGGTLAGGPAGGLAGATAALSPLFAGANIGRAVAETGDATPEQVAKSFAIAPVQAASETILGRLMPGAGKLLGSAASSATGNFAMRGLKQGLKGVAEEGLAELGQAAGERWAAGLDLTSPEATNEFIQAFATGGMIGGVVGGIGGITRRKPDQTSDQDLAKTLDTVLAGGPIEPSTDIIGDPADWAEAWAASQKGQPEVQQELPLAPRFEQFPVGYQADLLAPPTYDVLQEELAKAPTEALDAVIAKGDATPAPVMEAVKKEKARRAKQPVAEVPVAEAVELGLTSRPAEPQGVAAPVSAKPDPVLTNPELDEAAWSKNTWKGVAPIKALEPLRGLSREGFGPAFDALIASGLEGKSVERLAKNAGIDLNEPGASSVLTRALRVGQKARPAFVEMLSTADRATLAQEALDAMGKPDPVRLPPEVDALARQNSANDLTERVNDFAEGAQSRSDAVSGIVEQLGLVGRAGLTEAGVSVARKLSVSLEESTKAAEDKGFTGKAASMFVRGAEGKAVKKFDSEQDKKAYDAGVAWKVPETSVAWKDEATRAAEETGLTGYTAQMFVRGAEANPPKKFGSRKAEEAFFAGDKWYKDRKANSAVGRVESQNPDFARRDSLVEMIDRRQAEAVYQGASPEEVEQLRRLVREGATDQEVDDAEEALRAGLTVMPQLLPEEYRYRPERLTKALRSAQPLVQGDANKVDREVITRGAPTTRSVERAQLRARDEINMDFKEGKITAEERDAQISTLSVGNLAAEDLGLGREATRREVAAAKREKAEKATAKRIEKVRQKVREHYEDSNKTPADRRKFMSLIRALNEGNTGEVLGALEDQQRSALRTGFDDAGDPPVSESVTMELSLDGKPFSAALDYIVHEASNKLERAIAESVRSTIQALSKSGMKFEFKIAHAGDMIPEKLQDARGLAKIEDGVTTIWLNGHDRVGQVGTDYSTLFHEMIHAATSVAALVGEEPRYQRTELSRAVTRLKELMSHIKTEADRALSIPGAAQARIAVQMRGGTDLEKRDAMVEAGVPRILANWYLGSNLLENPRELLAWGLSDPDFQQWLDTVQYTPQQTLWGRFVSAVRDVLGLSEREDTALKALLQVSEDIMNTTARNSDSILSVGEWTLKGTMVEAKRGAGAVDRSINALKDALPQLDNAVQRVPLITLKSKALKSALGWFSTDHIAKVFAKILPEASALPAIDAARHASHAKLSQLFSPIHQAFGQLTPKYQDLVQSLMRATEFGVDPGKAWEDQTWLHKLPNADDIKAELVVWNNDLNTLRRNKPDGTVRQGQNDVSAAQVYEDLKALNDAVLYSETAMSLSNLVVLDPELSKSIAGFELDAMERFREDPNVNTSPAAARDYWKNELDGYVKNVQTFIDDFRGLKIQLPRQDQLMVEQRLAPIETRLKTIKVSMATAQEHPYFHLGRHGDQFVSFTVRNTKGVSDKVAVQKVAQALAAAGLEDIYISTNNTKPEMYARFDTEEARAKADAVLKQLRTDGWLDPEAEIKSGPRSTGGYIGRAAKPEWLDEWLSMVAANPVFATEGLNKEDAKEVTDSRDRFISQMREMWLDTLSDTALTKVMVKRKGTAGYARDMMRNYSQRYQMHALAIANLSAAPKITEAFTNIRSAVNQARNIDDKRHADVQAMFDIQNELLERHYSRDNIERTVFSDRLRAGTNAFFLGMSPGYLLTQVTQLGVLLLPELGKKHGYSKSFGSIARNTGTAFKVMSAVMAEGAKRKSGGVAAMLDGIADMAITPGVLQKAGLTASQEKFLHKMIASGKIDIGSAVRELGRVAEGEVDHKGDRAIRWATAMGLYTETLTRITAALAAQELYADGKAKGSVEDYAANILDEAMLNYASSNTSRKMGKQGVLGQYTPLATQFMQYSAQLMQKLYREAHKAFGGDKEAMRFLGGHFAAVGALAGTLGLPFATIVATAAESLVDLFGDDDEPYDATAAWRGWLTEMFGETLGTTLARGVPRGMLNFDLSERVGEQDLLPFSDVISDRRSMKDSLEANTFQSLGAPISMMYNVSSGLLDIINGDVVVGMQKAFPVALANVVKGTSLAVTGEYKTGKGETLPIEGDGWDVMVQLMGLNPSVKAEYAEKNRDFNELRTSATARATQLRNKIVRAILDGDAEAAREGIRRASEFDADNPDYAVLPDIESSLRTRVKKSAVAESTGMPLGVAPDDIQARELLAY